MKSIYMKININKNNFRRAGYFWWLQQTGIDESQRIESRLSIPY